MLAAAWAACPGVTRGASSSSKEEGSAVPEWALVPTWDASSSRHGECLVSKPKVLIISAGGIGTTTTLSEFHKIQGLEANCPGDTDGLKHLPFNRLLTEHAEQISDVKRILYLWGDPMHAVASLYRRGFQVSQATKTRSEPFPDGSFSKEAAARATPLTIGGYARVHHDVFQLQKHIESYLAVRNESVGMAFLQMEKKTDHLDELARFLDVPRLELKKHLTPWRVARGSAHTPFPHGNSSSFSFALAACS